MQKMTEELELVKRAVSGDTDAFDELYRLKLRTISFHVSRVIKNPSDIEDIIQNVSVKIYRRIGSLKAPEAFNSWLQRIITNECYDFIRQNKHKQNQMNIDDYLNDIVEEDKEFLPKECLEVAELRETILSVIDHLSPKRKRAVIMYYYDDMSQKEIAYALGISSATVSTNIMRAKNLIKKEIEKIVAENEMPDNVGSGTVIGQLLASSAQILYPDASLDITAQTLGGAMKDSSGALLQAKTATIGTAKAASIGAKAGGVIGTKTIAIITSAVIIVSGTGYIAMHDGDILGGDDKTHAVAIEDGKVPSADVFAGEEESIQIVYTGGECDCGHLNPKSAILDDGDMEGQSYWTITKLSDGNTIQTGVGTDASAILRKLIDTQQDGVYNLSFKYTTDSGYLYTLEREFAIDTGTIAVGEYE
jgi:RNA polymerase sigma factor (sigma-70 family)